MCALNCCRGRIKRTVSCDIPDQQTTPVKDTGHDPLTPASAKAKTGFLRRVSHAVSPLLPAFLLALVPKCPFCLAAYIALGTGIGLSVAGAKLLHIFLLCAGIIPLSLFAAKHVGACFFPAGVTGWKLQQQIFIGMTGILIGCSILLLF